MMTRKKLLIPLSLILITLLPLIGCSVKDDGNKVESIDNSLLKGVSTLYLHQPTFTQMEELKDAENLSSLKVNELQRDASDSEYNDTLHFASYLPNLEDLEINTTSASLDISGLSGSKLRKLVLFVKNGSIISLDPLSGLSELFSLNIGTAGTLSLEPIAKCSSLDSLSLSCDSTDITPIATLPSLWRLGIRGGVEDLSGLAANRSLVQLFLYESSKGLEALVDVPLSYISANECASFKLEQLKGLSTVEAIAVSDEYISDIAALSSMDNIKSIYLSTAADNAALASIDNIKWTEFRTDAIDGFGKGIVISSKDAPELDLIVTSIPVNQLRDFLSKEGTSIILYGDWNR